MQQLPNDTKLHVASGDKSRELFFQPQTTNAFRDMCKQFTCMCMPIDWFRLSAYLATSAVELVMFVACAALPGSPLIARNASSSHSITSVHPLP